MTDRGDQHEWKRLCDILPAGNIPGAQDVAFVGNLGTSERPRRVWRSTVVPELHVETNGSAYIVPRCEAWEYRAYIPPESPLWDEAWRVVREVARAVQAQRDAEQARQDLERAERAARDADVIAAAEAALRSARG